MVRSRQRLAGYLYLALTPCFAVATTVQDFGQVPLSSTPVSQTLTYNLQGLAVAPSFSLAWSRDFKAATPSCTVAATTSCSIVITFNPLRPGLRQDVLLVRNQAGGVLTGTSLRGIGMSPLIALYPGVIDTFAGNGVAGYLNSSNQGLAQFWNPQAVAIDGGANALYVADTVNGAIRRIDLSSGAVTTVAGTGSNGYSGDGDQAASALLNTPTGVTIDGAGNLFIADQGNNVIRRVDAVTQIITTVAGGSTTPSGNDTIGDGGPATSAILYGPQSVAVDSYGNLYIADAYHQLVRTVNSSTGIISVFAGGGTSAGIDGFGDGEAATNAQLANPSGVALDSAGNLYIADTGDNLIRRVDMTTGIITAVAGNGTFGYSGDFGLATNASLASPQTIAIDAANDIYIADFGNNVIRQVSASSNKIFSVAGRVSTGYAGDGGNPTLAFLTSPMGIAVDENGDLYIGDSANNVIRHVTFQPALLTFPTEPVGAVSPAETVSPFNLGNEPLTLSSVGSSSSFLQTASGFTDCAIASVLAPGSTCNVAIEFAPIQTGPISGSLSLITNSRNSTANAGIGLSGIGSTTPGPVLSFSASALTFSPQVVATASAPQTVILTNSGGSDFSISGISLSGVEVADFEISTTCGSSLAAGADCTVSVTFTPTAAGTRSATVVFSDSVVGAPQGVSLSGIAGSSLAAATLSATSLTFAPQRVGTTSAAQTATLSNPGGFSLSISNISLSGSQAVDYHLATTCGSSLAAGANCAISLTFSPSLGGQRAATLLISDSAVGSTQSLALNGMGSLRVHCPSCGRTYPLEVNASPWKTGAAEPIETRSEPPKTSPPPQNPSSRVQPTVTINRRRIADRPLF